jgi:hypothetical protein
MKKYNVILLLFIFTLFCSGSCEDNAQRFIIQNSSEQEIIVIYSMHRLCPSCFITGKETKVEYEEFIYYRAVKPHSYKNFTVLGSYMSENKYDTCFIHAFNRIDMDTMSCEEFKQKYPLKKEWKVTLADMEACNWTLVYP